MTAYLCALRAEIVKARRAPVLWVAGAAITVLPLVGLLFMYILEDPSRAQRMGLLGQKAQLTAGAADWPTLLTMMAQGLSIAGTILFSLVTIWLFGREFVDRTVRILLALPVPRAAVVVAKGTVAAAWCALMALWVMALALVVGVVADLPGGSGEVVADFVLTGLRVAAMTIGLQAVTALVASLGRGYLAAVGFTFAVLALANIAAVLGFGSWFPWSVPLLASGMAGPDAGVPGAGGTLLVVATAAAGAAGTLWWWQRADQPG